MIKIFSSHLFPTGCTLLLGREFNWGCEGEEAAAVKHLSLAPQCDYQSHAWLSLPSTCRPFYLLPFSNNISRAFFLSSGWEGFSANNQGERMRRESKACSSYWQKHGSRCTVTLRYSTGWYRHFTGSAVYSLLRFVHEKHVKLLHKLGQNHLLCK